MAVKDVFSVELYKQSTDSFEDITSGILNVDITHGTEVYEGPYQQIDTGQFTIVTRNPNLDPKVNPDLKFQSFIRFMDSRNVEEGKTNTFFAGWVTDIDVQYQRNDDPIITITGTDIFGLYQQTVVTEDIEHQARGFAGGITEGPDVNGVSLYYLVNMESWSVAEPGTTEYIFNATTPGAIEPATPGDDYSTYAPARYLPQVGETLLEVLNKYTQTNLNYCSINHRIDPSLIKIYPFAKYNAFYWPPQSDPALEFPTYNFSSYPADGRPYESILINNGYRRVTNSITTSNETKTLEDPMDPYNTAINSTVDTFGPYINSESNTEYGTTALDLDTIIPTSISDEERYAKDIFQVVAFPSDEIQQITFDNARYEDIQDDYTYSFSQLNQFTRIKHQVSETETIDRFYDIAGIRHSITPDKWEMTFTFKPSQQEIAFQYQGEGQIPTIHMNSLTGDSNFNFIATITDYPTENIEKVIWCLNGTNTDVNEQWVYSVDGSRYKNGLQRNGLTQTWNFDDDGILQGPDFPTGGYGSGNWYVIAYVILKNGWVIAPNVKLTVGTPAVEADFTWSQNLTNNFGQVTFTDQSHNNETGETDSYLWDFGDGTTSTEQNPVHVYDPAPTTTTYSVSLTVFTYSTGTTKVYNTKTETVTLAQPTMTPNFTWTTSSSTATFTNTSINVGFEEPDAYLWNFGDGTTSTLKNPVKTFAAQANVPTNYSVTLTTRNIWEQTASVTKTVTIDSLYSSGTLPVTQIGIETSPYFQDGTTFIAYLKALRSDGANLSLNATTSAAANQTYVDITNNTATLPGTQLTRNPATSSGIYGLKRSGGTRQGNLLTTSISQTQNINNINMLFDDKYPAATYLFTTWDRVYATANDSFGGTYPIGYWDLPSIPNYAPRQTFGREYAMTPIRPMPPRIPYFKYTFNNRTVSFTSVETGTAYAWNFGDGTTSTIKNPVKTYSAKGTYTVTLTVTFSGGGTRTTTEPVIVESLVGYPVRYIKFAQKDHTGINAWDTPYINNVRPIFNRNALVQTSPVAKFYINPTNIAKSNTYSMQWYPGTVSPDQGSPTSPFDPVGTSNLFNGAGLRVKSLDGTFKTKWELTGDFGTAISNIDQFRAQFSRWSNYDGTSNPVCTGISYEVYVTDYVGAPSGISGATWTKIGDFTPTSMPLNTEKDYTMTPL
jgi:PKD repeat protein